MKLQHTRKMTSFWLNATFLAVMTWVIVSASHGATRDGNSNSRQLLNNRRLKEPISLAAFQSFKGFVEIISGAKLRGACGNPPLPPFTKGGRLDGRITTKGGNGVGAHYERASGLCAGRWSADQILWPDAMAPKE